jgi:hypothetical protein
MQKKLLRNFVIGISLLWLITPQYSQPAEKLTVGIYGGWSWGTGYTFRWHSRPWSDRHILQFHLGGYVQYNFSPFFGLQGDFNYQHVIDEWKFQYPGFPHDSGVDSYGFTSLGLKGIYSLPRWKSIQLFIAGGGGISWGEWYSYSGVYYHLVGNPGVKFFLWKSHPHLALTLGSSIVYLYNPDKYISQDDFYIRMNLGIEF